MRTPIVTALATVSVVILCLTSLSAQADSIIVAGSPPPAAAAGAYSYQGYAGGFRVGDVHMNIVLNQDRFAAEMRLETGGMVSWFVEWRHGSLSRGRAVTPTRQKNTEGGNAAPLLVDFYRNDSFWKGRDRYIEFAAKGGLAAVTIADPHPIRDEERPPVTKAQRTGVLDPLSAIIAIGRALELTGTCTATYPVFDGRRRYTLRVVDEGIAELEPSRRAPYEGDAQRCSFVFERVSGFRKEISDDEPTHGHVYYRRVAKGAPMMPVKIIAELEYGSAIINLKSYKPLDPHKAEQAMLKPAAK